MTVYCGRAHRRNPSVRTVRSRPFIVSTDPSSSAPTYDVRCRTEDRRTPTNGPGRRESPKDLRAAEPRLNLSLSRYTPIRSGRFERPGGFGCAVSESEHKTNILELWPVLLRFLVPSCI